jgi:hypothetical protein
MKRKKVKKPSFISQVLVLTLRSFDILFNDVKHLLMIAFLPILASVVISIVGKEQAFVNYEDTKIRTADKWRSFFSASKVTFEDKEIESFYNSGN